MGPHALFLQAQSHMYAYFKTHIWCIYRHPDPKSRPAFILITKYLNKPDEELLQISDEDIKLYGVAAPSLGRTLASSSPPDPSNVNTFYYNLQMVYK